MPTCTQNAIAYTTPLLLQLETYMKIMLVGHIIIIFLGAILTPFATSLFVVDGAIQYPSHGAHEHTKRVWNVEHGAITMLALKEFYILDNMLWPMPKTGVCWALQVSFNASHWKCFNHTPLKCKFMIKIINLIRHAYFRHCQHMFWLHNHVIQYNTKS